MMRITKEKQTVYKAFGNTYTSFVDAKRANTVRYTNPLCNALNITGLTEKKQLLDSANMLCCTEDPPGKEGLRESQRKEAIAALRGLADFLELEDTP